jgi:hypothetical protein
MKLIPLLLVTILSFLSFPTWSDDAVLQQAYQSQQSNVQVQGVGYVIKVLSDDTKGSQHQRFIVKLNSKQTLLIAHNIDLAPRIPNLKKGDKIQFYGEYEYNKQGGIVHWTHKAMQGNHVHGWLKRNRVIYQ